jgi:predicted RNase H-like nuclease (RuvC/YqgF family)
MSCCSKKDNSYLDELLNNLKKEIKDLKRDCNQKDEIIQEYKIKLEHYKNLATENYNRKSK